MGRKAENREIDGEIFTITMLRPRLSLALLTKLFKIIGPPIGKAFPHEIKVKEILDAGINLGGAISELSNRMSDTELQSIIDILFTQVMHKGMGVLSNITAYDELFSGRMKFLFKVVTIALEVQYADFFEGEDALAVIIRKSKEIAAQESEKIMTQAKQT